MAEFDPEKTIYFPDLYTEKVDTVSPNTRKLYTWLAENRPDVLEWYKFQAKSVQRPLGVILTIREAQIENLMHNRR